jgi:NADH-quinone oxidoreductase subunit K
MFLISFELLFLAVNLNMLLFSAYYDMGIGSIVALLLLTVAAGETTIGLALLLSFYRVRGSISVLLVSMKG